MVVERLDERLYEIETADGSTYRRNRIHLQKTNEPPTGETVSEPLQTPTHFRNARVANESPSGSTLTELPQVPNYSDKPDGRTPCEKSLARDPLHSEPCEETQLSPAEVKKTIQKIGYQALISQRLCSLINIESFNLAQWTFN